MDKGYKQILIDEGFSSDEIEYLEEYEKTLPSAEKIASLNVDELINAICRGDREAGNTLMLMYMRSVEEEAVARREEGIPVFDLIAEGNLALAETIVGFCADPDSIPADYDSAVNEAIWDAMDSFAGKTREDVIDSHIILEKANALLDAVDKLTRELGFKPNIDEIANEMGISQEAVLEILRMIGEDPDETETESPEEKPASFESNYIGRTPEL